ncbi:NADPH-dependent F420 reductase [Gallibacterium salpingitidis]|uniref:NADPH-dependent F420 reductase n=1 Tax=Gallibacterium salpingitidis TaxID=505341 RepID=UPI0022AAB2C4|nr:NADPH-dependent F420 reductase [Gallibacterium salpingitidis]
MKNCKNKEFSMQLHTIGILGTGMIGSALARLCVEQGYDVILSQSKNASALKQSLGDKAKIASVEEVASQSDLVIAAIPFSAYQMLPVKALSSKIVIETMNYYPSVRDGHFPDLDQAHLTSSEMIQHHLKDSFVVKALHNLDFHHLYANARPFNHPERTTLPVAGDDEAAKQTVIEFIQHIGYNAVDIGTLSESWRIEPGTPLYVWPYVPTIPDEFNEEQARQYYLTHAGKPLTALQVKEMAANTQRHFPVGGYAEDLPTIHTQLVAEIYQQRQAK